MKQRKTKLTTIAAAVLAVGMTVSPILVPMANAQISFHLGWQAPPPEFNDIQRQGFHAGIDAARHDIDFGMPPDPRRHGEFRHPPVPGPARDDFRHSFGRGYEMAYQHRGEWDRDHHDWGGR